MPRSILIRYFNHIDRPYWNTFVHRCHLFKATKRGIQNQLRTIIRAQYRFFFLLTVIFPRWISAWFADPALAVAQVVRGALCNTHAVLSTLLLWMVIRRCSVSPTYSCALGASTNGKDDHYALRQTIRSVRNLAVRCALHVYKMWSHVCMGFRWTAVWTKKNQNDGWNHFYYTCQWVQMLISLQKQQRSKSNYLVFPIGQLKEHK